MGIHLVISVAVVATSGLTAGVVNASIGTADTLLTTIASRTLSAAQLAVTGAHYFIPVPVSAMIDRYFGVQMVATTHVADSGTGVMWFGPKTGGEQ